jgi:hypothetical protein
MATLTARQLYDLARTAGLSPTAAVVAAAVALAESGGNTAAVGDVSLQTGTWGPSIGLWQIRSLKADYGTGRARDAARLADPAFNARSMVEISSKGANWRPWSVFTSGKYRQHLDTVSAAAGQPRHPRADNASGSVTNAPTTTTGPLGGVVDAVKDLNPLAVFDGWQNDLQAVAVKLAVTGAALWLVVAGVRSTVGAGGGS